MWRKELFILITCSLILTSCKVTSNEPTTTSILSEPSPTLIVKAETPSAIPGTAVPSVTPSVTPTETVEVVPEAIDIQFPLPGQWVSSTQVELRGIADPTFEQNLSIRLLTMDGTELVATSTIIQADAGQRGGFSTSLVYNAGDAKDGMIQVFSRSPKDGSLEHLSSRMVKFGNGTASPLAKQQPNEKISLQLVRIGQSNTKLLLEGEGSAVGIFENTLLFKLCGDGGVGTADFFCGGADNVIIASNTMISATEMGSPGTFSISAELPNGKWRNGRVVVYSISPANGQVEHASSLLIRNGP